MNDWTGNAQAVMATLNASGHSSSTRESLDYYATPVRAVKELIRLESFKNPVWECACGELAISSELENAGYIVRSSDIVDRCNNEVFDFLGIEQDQWSGDIVTNPPFAKATEFLERALSVIGEERKIAFFLRVQFLEGVRRRQLFDNHPPRRVWVASRNLRCAKNGDFANATGNASTYCWFVWEKGFTGKPEIGWFN
jgi:hypothetical protein